MDLEKRAIKFIKTIRYSIKGDLYAGNSGGKDSAVLDKLLQLSNINYISYHTNTTLDPPGTLSHIRKYYPYTQILQPKESFRKLVMRKGLPNRYARWCCSELKEYGSIGRSVFEGIRKSESSKRKGRDYIECDTRKWQNGAKHIYPIYDWTDADVFDFIKKYNIILAPHYKHANRMGCVGCPLVNSKTRRKEFKLYPKYFEVIKRAMSIGMSNNPQWKIVCASNNDIDLVMEWWLSSQTIEQYFKGYDFKKTEEGWVKEKQNNLFGKDY